MSQRESSLIRSFADVGLGDLEDVGGKNAALGELIRELGSSGVRVPDGFAVTTDAYRLFLERGQLTEVLQQGLDGLDPDNVSELRRRASAIRTAIESTPLPPELADAIRTAYTSLRDGAIVDVDVAVRSSATAEDLPGASFAGQQESYLNVRGAESLLEACRRCYASLFTDRAISYRAQNGFDHLEAALSVGVQRMVRSDLASSGVMFSIDTESGFRDVVLIQAAYGLGENIVQGSVTPDEFCVFKPTLLSGHRPVVRRARGSKELRMIYGELGGTRNVVVDLHDRQLLALDDDEVLQLARWAIAIEERFTHRHGRFTPVDIEWAKDGLSGELFILQARPETVQAHRSGLLTTSTLLDSGPVLVEGQSVGDQIATGRTRIISSVDELPTFQTGEVLVADRTDPDWEPVMRRAAAIVTNRGGRTCHAAIVSRELGVPAVVGTGTATELLPNGTAVTVSCAEGDVGRVFEGSLRFRVDEIDPATLPSVQTQVMLNIADPASAFRLAQLPSDGVGLARLEFIIGHAVGIHPLALAKFDDLDPATRALVEELTPGYSDKRRFFIDRLAEGVGAIAAAFYPRDVIVRLSDFKSNEYAGLVAGAAFEPIEENPMLGWRGAVRFYDDRFRDAFALECQALRRVREEMGLTNVKLMVPFCRTVEEGRRVQEEMARHGLRRGENGLELYVMCEVPSNVLLADQFAEIFDGFSIGSNDLTQLTLGVDRDSELVAHLFDERDPAVTWMIRHVITAARANGRKIGLCGQAPSDHPEFARMLVEAGIDSISVNPDAVVQVLEQVAAAEAMVAAGT